MEDNFLLESIATCYGKQSDFVMYFTVNTAFMHYFDNMTNALDIHISHDWTTDKQAICGRTGWHWPCMGCRADT